MQEAADTICGYCGSHTGDNPTPVYPMNGFTAMEERTAKESGHRGMLKPPSRVRWVCSSCSTLKRFPCREVWSALLRDEVGLIASIPDEVLWELGAEHIRPLADLNGGWHTLPPGEPWWHLDPAPLRMALAMHELGQLIGTEPERSRHPSRRGCRVCGTSTAEKWSMAGLRNGWPLCEVCASHDLDSVTDFGAPWRLIASVLGLNIHKGPVMYSFYVNHYEDVDGVDPAGVPERWGFVSESDRQKLRKFLAENYRHHVPHDWVAKWGRKKAPTPKARRSAVAV